MSVYLAAFTNVPVMDEHGVPLLPEMENVIERAEIPCATMDDALALVDAFALDLMFRADEDPSALAYKGVVVAEVTDDGTRILSSAGRNLMP